MLLKLSGEALAGPQGYGIDATATAVVADKVLQLTRLGVEVAVVMGAGNLWRGSSEQAADMDRASADQIGMLATVMNALALQDALERQGQTVRVHTAIEMKQVAESYIRRRAMHQLDKGHVVVLGAGTGNPFFTTDTAAALRAMELGCEVLIKATKVDGIYSADPKRFPDAERFEHLSYGQAVGLGLRVMDTTAFTLCMENDMPILVLNLWSDDDIRRAVLGQAVGTTVNAEDGHAVQAMATPGTVGGGDP